MDVLRHGRWIRVFLARHTLITLIHRTEPPSHDGGHGRCTEPPSHDGGHDDCTETPVSRRRPRPLHRNPRLTTEATDHSTETPVSRRRPRRLHKNPRLTTEATDHCTETPVSRRRPRRRHGNPPSHDGGHGDGTGTPRLTTEATATAQKPPSHDGGHGPLHRNPRLTTEEGHTQLRLTHCTQSLPNKQSTFRQWQRIRCRGIIARVCARIVARGNVVKAPLCQTLHHLRNTLRHRY